MFFGDEIGLQVFFGWEETFDGQDFLIYGLDKEWMLKHPEMEQEKPARYIGGEVNMVKKNPKNVDVRFAMCFPDVYIMENIMFKYETHLHTVCGSACASISGRGQAIEYHKAGYSGIFITDHFFRGNTCVPNYI